MKSLCHVKLSDFMIQYLHVVTIVCVLLMMFVSVTTVTHSADFFSSPVTEDHDPQPTPKPGK